MNDRIVESDLQYITGTDLPWESLRNKTVLISGASGFLPSYMVLTLLYLNRTKHLNVTVVGLVRDLEKARKRFSCVRKYENLKLICQNICTDIRIQERVHFIVHAASLASPKRFGSDPVGTISPNVIGTDNLLKLAVKNSIECFLFFSTSGVYGYVSDDAYPIKEDSFGSLNPTDLESCYLESKRMGENMCIAWMHQYKVPIKIVRPAITYGPGIRLDDGRSFADFISNIVNYRDIELYSDGRAVRNFCYLADATLGFFTVMLKGQIGKAYNIATDHEISIADLAKMLVEKVFPERELKVIKKPVVSKNYLRMNFSRTTVDISRAKALGWKLRFPVEAGFRRTVESIENNRSRIGNSKRV